MVLGVATEHLLQPVGVEYATHALAGAGSDFTVISSSFVANATSALASLEQR